MDHDTAGTNPTGIRWRSVMGRSEAVLVALRAIGTARAWTAVFVDALHKRLAKSEPIRAEPPPDTTEPPQQIVISPQQAAILLLATRGSDAFWAASLESIRELRAGDKAAFWAWKRVADAVEELEQAAERAQTEPDDGALEQAPKFGRRSSPL